MKNINAKILPKRKKTGRRLQKFYNNKGTKLTKREKERKKTRNPDKKKECNTKIQKMWTYQTGKERKAKKKINKKASPIQENKVKKIRRNSETQSQRKYIVFVHENKKRREKERKQKRKFKDEGKKSKY